MPQHSWSGGFYNTAIASVLPTTVTNMDNNQLNVESGEQTTNSNTYTSDTTVDTTQFQPA